MNHAVQALYYLCTSFNFLNRFNRKGGSLWHLGIDQHAYHHEPLNEGDNNNIVDTDQKYLIWRSSLKIFKFLFAFYFTNLWLLIFYCWQLRCPVQEREQRKDKDILNRLHTVPFLGRKSLNLTSALTRKKKT